MSSETLLLLEIIRSAPDGADWIISNDSWEDIRNIFHFDITESKSHWTIIINDFSRSDIIKKISSSDLGEKIVHMWLVSKEGLELASCLDRMAMVTLSKDLKINTDVINTLHDLEVFFD